MPDIASQIEDQALETACIKLRARKRISSAVGSVGDRPKREVIFLQTLCAGD
jgi:hypothetical protein